MRFSRYTLETCSAAAGAVVVIDVIRAFTTAAFAFGAGAGRILLVDTVEEALALRQRTPGARVMGEVGGRRPPHPAHQRRHPGRGARVCVLPPHPGPLPKGAREPESSSGGAREP
jgi:hypothetical protein